MEKLYQNILAYIRQHNLTKITIILTKASPYIIALIYALILLILMINKSNKLLITIIKPLITFIIITILRKLYDKPRPCVIYQIEPLLEHKKGQSFPSRHTASAFSIALALFNINNTLGIITLIIAMIVALTRIMCGLHFIKDVITGIIIAIIINLI